MREEQEEIMTLDNSKQVASDGNTAVRQGLLNGVGDNDDFHDNVIAQSTPGTFEWLAGVVQRASSIMVGNQSNAAAAVDPDEYDFVASSEAERETEERWERIVRSASPGTEDLVLQMFLERRVMELESQLEKVRDSWERSVELLQRQLQRETMEHQQTRDTYQKRIEELEAKVKELEGRDSSHDQPEDRSQGANLSIPSNEMQVASTDKSAGHVSELSIDQIERYSRQLLLQNGFGVKGQCKLLSSSVLVVGAGGIGSTVLLYLAASGVGNISVVDFDAVDKSNLHRQILHQERNVGMNKAVSACRAMSQLNPSIRLTPIQEPLTDQNALDLVSQHDCVVDASDNPLTRYLINDACVLANKPLVSGSAMETEGQLTVYNHNDGPCYRCLYPKPNRTEGCKSCSDNGVLGPVPGLIGVLQSIEALKILTGIGTTMGQRLLMYDSLRCSFMSIKKPPKSKRCPVCSDQATIRSMADSVRVNEGARGPNICPMPTPASQVGSSLPSTLHVSCRDYRELQESGKPHVLLDVRAERQFDICSLPNSVNIPLASLSQNLDRLEELSNGTKPVYCLCRRGVFSVEATKILSEAMQDHPRIVSVRNIWGGLQSWSKEIDPSFPVY